MKIKTQKKADAGVPLSPGEMESFLEDMRARGRVEDTLDWYRRGLRKLYLFLPEEKCIRRGTLARWRSDLLAEGYASSTVNLFLSGANSYLEYRGFREFQLTGQLKKERKLQPELTRNEYLHLLRTAKALERERTYLLVKFLRPRDFPCRRLDACRWNRCARAGFFCRMAAPFTWPPASAVSCWNMPRGRAAAPAPFFSIAAENP